MKITDEMVERAAEALYAALPSGRYEYNNGVAWVTTTWEELLPGDKDIRRTQARTALTAALGDVELFDMLLDGVDERCEIKSVNKWANGEWGCVLGVRGRLLPEVTGPTRMAAIRAAVANAKDGDA